MNLLRRSYQIARTDFCGLALLLMASACAPKPVATVGDFHITRRMVEYREQVALAFSAQAKSGDGLEQLIRSYTHAQILKNWGRPIDDEMLRAERQRLALSVKNPAMLAKVKAIFGSDEQAYLKVFVLPYLADRMIYADLFLKDERIQAEAYARVKAFHGQAMQRPSAFRKLAIEAGLEALKLSVTGRVEEDKVWREHVIAKTKVGQVFAEPLDMDQYWLVLRNAGSKGKSQELEVVKFPRADYKAWLTAERSRVKIERF